VHFCKYTRITRQYLPYGYIYCFTLENTTFYLQRDIGTELVKHPPQKSLSTSQILKRQKEIDMAPTESQKTTSKIPLPTLPSRYEIRQLTAEHESWTTAMQYHSNIFHSPHKYTPYFHGRKTKFTLNAVRTSPSAFGYAIKHNRCWGVFDTEYVYRRPESAATGGAVYWDELWDQLGPDGKLPGDDDDETLGDRKLLEAMDFPLVSFAISHDDTISAPMDLLMEMARAAPDVVKLYVAMDVLRAVQKKEAIEEGRFEETKGRVGWRLKRAGTATRSDYEGRGIMKALNLWVLDYAEKEGFTRVIGNTSNRAVGHVVSSNFSYPLLQFQRTAIIHNNGFHFLLFCE
jgi:GNAT superfamily N-acetyltransferase